MINPHAVAEATMDSLWSFYEAGTIDPTIALLKSLGHSPEAVDFALNPDSYYFPNVRGTMLVKPATVDQDLIPVVALENGTTYHFQRPSLHYLQRTALHRAGVLEGDIQLWSTAFSNMGNEVSTSGGPQGTGSLYSPPLTVGKNPLTHLQPKPTLIFNLDRQEGPLQEDLTSVGIHELTHIVQMLSNPVRKHSERLQRELEAYAVQATLVRNYAVPYNLSTAAAGEVNAFRVKYLGKDQYTPTEEFTALFHRQDLFARIIESVA